MNRKSGPSRLGRFLSELKRRHVGRTAIAYAAIAFVLLQTGEIILPAFDLPERWLRLLVVLSALGLPPAIVLAWIYEITPHGIRRMDELDAEAGRSLRRDQGSLLPRLALLAVTTASVGVAGLWTVQFVDEGAVSTADQPSLVRPASFDPNAPIRSLAVLPLDNFSQNSEQDYFTAALHEELISQLSQLETVRVVSRTSVLRYANTDTPVPTIARDLGVDAIVEGSVLRDGDLVRITVQLIHAASDTHLWSRSYEKELTNVIELQREVATAIAQEIQGELNPEEEPTLFASTPAPTDAGAADAYLRGRFELAKETPEGFEAAIGHFEDAVRMDSTFAPAYTGLAGSHLMMGVSEAEMGTDLPEAREAALRAIELDEGSSAEAQDVLALIERELGQVPEIAFSVVTGGSDSFTVVLNDLVLNDRDWAPDSTAWTQSEWMSTTTQFGRRAQAMIDAKKVERGGPVGVRVMIKGPAAPQLVIAAKQLSAVGHHEAAAEMLREVIGEDPGLPAAWDALEEVYVAQSDYAAAVDVWSERLSATMADPEMAAARIESLRDAVAQAGEDGYWRWRLDELEDRQNQGESVSPVDVAATYARLNQLSEAKDWLARAYRVRDPHLRSLATDPTWDVLRRDPEFREMMRGLRRSAVRRPPSSNRGPPRVRPPGPPGPPAAPGRGF